MTMSVDEFGVLTSESDEVTGGGTASKVESRSGLVTEGTAGSTDGESEVAGLAELVGVGFTEHMYANCPFLLVT